VVRDPALARLLRRTAVALLIAAALVVLCYFFVDRPVAYFVHDRGVSSYPVLKWLTYPPPVLQAWAPAVLVALVVRRAWGPFRHWEKALLAAAVGIVLADQFRESLAYLFGRYWPETWTDDNPSLIGDDAYGFHPFHGGSWYRSFPSGHMTRTVALAAVVWIAFPRWRWACVLGTIVEAVGLIGMDYHFVGDVVGGSFVGGTVGIYTAYFCGVSASTSQP
jgi:membrane-associated phospholipid phosphatase